MTNVPPVFILCGGKATRLGTLCHDVAKSMIQFDGRPFLSYQLQALKQQGVERVVLCVSHHAKQIQDFVGTGSAYDMDVRCIWDSGTGTGGALRNAALSVTDRLIVVLYGDSFVTCSIEALVQQTQLTHWGAIAASPPRETDVDRPNIALVDGLAFYSKRNPLPTARHVDHGISIIDRGVFLFNTGGGSFDLGEYYEIASANRKLAGLEIRTPYYEIGSYAGMARFRDVVSRWRTDL